MLARTGLWVVLGILLSAPATAGRLSLKDSAAVGDGDEARIKMDVRRGPASLEDGQAPLSGFCEDVAGRAYRPGDSLYGSCLRDNNPYRRVPTLTPPVWYRPRHYDISPAQR